MMKLDETPLSLPRADGGEDFEIPKEHRPRFWLILAVAAAKNGDPESVSPDFHKKGVSGERRLLATILSEHGFDDELVAYLLDCIAPKKVRGRRRGSPQQLWAKFLDAIKDELSAAGHTQWGIHKDAMSQLEKKAPEIEQYLLPWLGPAFDPQKLEDYVRRSKKSRPKKSRAK